MQQNKSQRYPSSTGTMTSSHRMEPRRKSVQLSMQFNQEIFKRDVLTDVECVVEGQVFKSHRALLVCFSPYLKRKLINDEGKPISKRIQIPKVGSNDFEILLRYMYNGKLEVDCNNFFDIYKASSLLEMQDVKYECLEMIDGNDEIKTYFYAYVLSKKLGVEHNWQKALRLITHRFEETVFSKEFIELDINYVLEILSSQYIGARSETIVFLAALNWLNHDFVSRGVYSVTVMDCVRFSSMSMEEIVACYHPPFLAHVVQIPEVTMMLFRATCYIAAKSQGQETWFKQYAVPKRNLTFESLPMELWHKKPSAAIMDSTDLRMSSGYQNRVEQWNNESGTFSRNNEHHNADFTESDDKHLEQLIDPKFKEYVAQAPGKDDTSVPVDMLFGRQPYVDNFNEELESDDSDEAESIVNVLLSKKDYFFHGAPRSEEYDIRKRIPSTIYEEVPDEACEMEYVAPESTKIVHLIKGPQKFAAEKTKTEQVQDKKIEAVSHKSPQKDKSAEAEKKPTKQQHSFVSKEAKKCEEPKVNPSLSTETFSRHDEERVEDDKLHQSSSDKVVSKEQDQEEGCILVIGGMNPKNIKNDAGGEVFILNVNTDKWQHYTNIPEPRHNHGAICFKNSLYVVGGCNPQETIDKNHYIAKRACFKLNLKNSKWSKMADMKCARFDHALVICNEQLFVIGGQDETGRLLKTVEKYDLKKNRWKLMNNSSMCCGRKAMGAAAYADRIWVAGGLIQSRSGQLQAVSHVDCFHPGEKKWYFNLYSLPAPRCFCSLVEWEDKLHCLGGMVQTDDEKTCPTDEVWYVDSDTKLWKTGPKLPEPRMGGVAVTYAKNLYYLGGFDPDNNGIVQHVIFLTPGAASWKTGPPMPSYLFGLSAVSFKVE